MFWFVVVCCEKTLGFFCFIQSVCWPPGARGPSPAGGGGNGGGGGGGGACAWVPDPNAQHIIVTFLILLIKHETLMLECKCSHY